MSTLDRVLTFVAACIGALVGVDPFGLPSWVQGVAVVLTIGFAAIGIYTSNPVGPTPGNFRTRTGRERRPASSNGEGGASKWPF